MDTTTLLIIILLVLVYLAAAGMGDAAGTDADAIEPPHYFDQGITKGTEGGVSLRGRANEHEASNSGKWSHRLAARSHGRVRGTSWYLVPHPNTRRSNKILPLRDTYR